MPEFIALADVLRMPATAGSDEREAAALVPSPEVVRSDDATADCAESADTLAAARDARLFRARLADAFDTALARSLSEVAADVLARELRLAPCDLEALARRVLAGAPVVRVRVAPAEAGRDYGLPAVADPALQPGDAVFELAGGALDARLGVRLASVLEGAGR